YFIEVLNFFKNTIICIFILFFISVRMYIYVYIEFSIILFQNMFYILNFYYNLANFLILGSNLQRLWQKTNVGWMLQAHFWIKLVSVFTLTCLELYQLGKEKSVAQQNIIFPGELRIFILIEEAKTQNATSSAGEGDVASSPLTMLIGLNSLTDAAEDALKSRAIVSLSNNLAKEEEEVDPKLHQTTLLFLFHLPILSVAKIL
ncbi:hypothetical protein ACJX0J_034428, partial [Zea mays]